MSTASTKSRNRKRRAAGRSAETKNGAASARDVHNERNVRQDFALLDADESGAPVSPQVWLFGRIGVLFVAALLRLYDLNLVPYHHDEGVNGFFLTQLVRAGEYKYNPENYHGPTLYYLSLPLEKLFGLNVYSTRLLTVLFGIALVWLAFALWREIGKVGALACAALLAVSPGATYLARYYIHETLFVFFTFGAVVAVLHYRRERNPLWVLACSVCLALLAATKETWFISVGVLLIAWACVWFEGRFFNGVTSGTNNHGLNTNRDFARHGALRPSEPNASDVWSHLLFWLEVVARFIVRMAVWIAALALFVFINVLFYSSFFKFPEGVRFAVEALQLWSKTGASDFHAKSFETYFVWLWRAEGALLLLALVGTFIAVWYRRTRRNGFALFAALWWIGITLAYSLIPYKTPWLALSFIVPLAICAGYAVDSMYLRGADYLQGRALALTLVAFALGVGLYQSYKINFVGYDDDNYVYVYAHTSRDVLRLVKDVESIAWRSGEGVQTQINVMADQYWSLPWYFRDYPNAGFGGRVTFPTNEPVIIVTERQEPELAPLVTDAYVRVGSYILRPGETLALYARRDLVTQ